MATNDQRFQLALAEARQSQLRAEHFKVRIETGQFLKRVVRHGGPEGPLLTPDELVADEVRTMHRHIQLAEDHLEFAKGFLSENSHD